MPEQVASFLDVVGMSAQTWFAILGLLVLGGVIGKSAQFPLHTWLPDAMEGPTPVSALIHAATMVAAGVYLVARMYGFYALLPTVRAIIALVGGFTALFAATMGVVKDEIKQVLAYSTISQYGYMMLGLGSGRLRRRDLPPDDTRVLQGAAVPRRRVGHHRDAPQRGHVGHGRPEGEDARDILHVPLRESRARRHRAVRGLLVEGRGAVLRSQLRPRREPILLAAYAMGLLAVLFTGFYTFRMVLLTFHGDARSDTARDPHGVGWNVKFPLVVLGILAATAGLVNMTPVAELTGAHIEFLHQWLVIPEGSNFAALGYDHYHHLLVDFSGYGEAELSPLLPGAVSLALALTGAGLAWFLYSGDEPTEHTEKLGAAKTVLYNNYYQDEYQVWLAEGSRSPSRALPTPSTRNRRRRRQRPQQREPVRGRSHQARTGRAGDPLRRDARHRSGRTPGGLRPPRGGSE